MKVFISIPMIGKDDEQIKEEMDLVKENIKNGYPGAEILDSFITENPPEEVKSVPAWYLGKSIEILAQADLAVFVGDWKEARGCVIERSVAIAYRIPFIEIGLVDMKETEQPMIIIHPSPTADSRTAEGDVTKEELFDSSLQHINDVRKALYFFQNLLAEAGKKHDFTKVDDPCGLGITSFYDSFSRKLTGDSFKSEPWFQRHIREERHHLTDRCPNDVNLIDVLERIADITMAGMARSGEVWEDKLDSEVLERAYLNTLELLKQNVEVEN